MCDAHLACAGKGWRGWKPLPPARRETPSSDWVDLTWPFSPDVPRLPFFPPPRIERIRTVGADRINISVIETIVHIGTHLDSPGHFYEDAPGLEAIPLERMSGSGVVWRIDKPLYGVIEPSDLEQARPQLRPGDILLLDTGVQERFGTEDYLRHAYLSPEAAQWIVDQDVKLVGIDGATPDAPSDRRSPDFDWPVHRTLLSSGVLVAEQVTNLRVLAGRRVELVFGIIPVVDGDGAPGRVLARTID